MMHTIRLLQVAEEILTTGKLSIKRTNREELLAIKSGQFDYEELLKKAEALRLKIEDAYEKTTLPMLPDAPQLEKVLIAMRTALY